METKKHIEYFGQETSWNEKIVTFRNNGISSKAGLRNRVNGLHWLKIGYRCWLL